ncbi:MAG: hypothetical protein IJS61_00450 [Firmicutes bacterium]|nr:hypothetical protein [Bacillota bacterium]
MADKLQMEKAYTEILEVMKYFPKKDRDKIPEEEVMFFRKYCDKTYDFHIDASKPLEDTVLLKETDALIVSLYRKYVLPPDKREMLDKILELNDKKAKLEEYENMMKEE